MKTVREMVGRAPVWVTPDHTIDTAIVLMRGYGVSALPVVDAGSVVGMAGCCAMLGAEPAHPVRDVMDPSPPLLTPGMTVREAADIMVRARASHLPVVDDGKLVGVITRSDLLPEVGRSYDPLTGLPWTDSLHEWAIAHFRRGLEITVLFLDLDDFGRFNKVYGHVIGDEVLRSVADTVSDCIEPETDFLCRYGGDEFCIASLRQAPEAATLADRITARVKEIQVPALGGGRLSCCVGQWGGMRTREREHVHFAATINNLINLASRDCTRKKPKPAPAGAPAAAPGGARRLTGLPGRIYVDRVDVSRVAETTTARVTLRLGDSSESPGRAAGADVAAQLASVATARSSGGVADVPRLVAEATAVAIRALLPAVTDITLAEIAMNQTATREAVVTIIGEMSVNDERHAIAGSAVGNGDGARAAAKAIVAAVSTDLGGTAPEAPPSE